VGFFYFPLLSVKFLHIWKDIKIKNINSQMTSRFFFFNRTVKLVFHVFLKIL